MIERKNAFFAAHAQEGAQWGLLCLMTGISEESWAAGWLIGLEITLWDAAHGEGQRRLITERQAALLKLLSEEADGWWVWDDENGPLFLSLEEWRAKRDELRKRLDA